MDGILIVHKESGMTSRDVVDQVGNLLKTKKIGHTGTLDPMATGVLILCLGECSKLAELLTAEEKEYEAEMILGLETDTLDTTGTILKNEEVSVSEEEVKRVMQEFIGTYEQEVPLYSAVKKNGKKLYEYAREGKEVTLPKRDVTIRSLTLLSYKKEDAHIRLSFRTTVSKGTYIRSLIRDLAASLGTVGVMSGLKRTKQGSYSLEEAVTLSEIKEGQYRLISKEELFEKVPKVWMNQELEEKVKNGALLVKETDQDPVFFMNQKGILKAIYHTYDKDPTKIKPWKMFESFKKE